MSSPQITRDPENLPLTDAQTKVLQKFFLNEGYPVHVTAFQDEGEVFCEIAKGHPEHEPGNGHYLTPDGYYVLPGIGGSHMIRPENM